MVGTDDKTASAFKKRFPKSADTHMNGLLKVTANGTKKLKLSTSETLRNLFTWQLSAFENPFQDSTGDYGKFRRRKELSLEQC